MTNAKVRRAIEVVAAGAVVAAAALAALGPMPRKEHWFAAAFFAGFGLLASGLGYKTSRDTSGTIGFLPFLSVAAISPNFAAVASVFAGVLGGELIAKKQPIKMFFNLSQQVFAESLAICCYLLLGGRSVLGDSVARTAAGAQGTLLNGSQSAATFGIAFAAMILVFMTVNKLAVSTVVAESSGGSVTAHWLRSMRGSFIYDILAFPLILFFVYAYSEWGPWWSACLALPMLGLRQLYKSNFALQKINEELLQLMVAAIEARDPYTSGHSQRVARYARVIARAAGLSTKAVDRVVVAALLHDVGKIHEEFAPILRKPGRLTDEEFAIMKSHSARSATLVGKVSHFADLVSPVLSHHEAWDGRGYPHGLSGNAIPLGARVIALADTIDAMSTSRPYREALSSDSVRDEVRRESGRQFDPGICRAILTGTVWRDIEREILLAIGEYPVHPYFVAHADGHVTEPGTSRNAR